jgi:hypothetical protein
LGCDAVDAPPPALPPDVDEPPLALELVVAPLLL